MTIKGSERVSKDFAFHELVQLAILVPQMLGFYLELPNALQRVAQFLLELFRLLRVIEVANIGVERSSSNGVSIACLLTGITSFVFLALVLRKLSTKEAMSEENVDTAVHCYLAPRLGESVRIRVLGLTRVG